LEFDAMNAPQVDAVAAARGARDPAEGRRTLRLALAGGGTGGHIVPGLHLLDCAAARESVADVVWFQTGRSVEQRVLAGVEQRLEPARLERVTLSLEPEGGGAPSLARVALHSLPAIARARSALRAHQSQVLVGLGGFTSMPAVLAARSLGIPVALLEINAHAGRATRWLTFAATRVLHAWKATLPAGADPRHVWIGPPLSRVFSDSSSLPSDRALARSRMGFDPERELLVVLGGSQGARGLNRFVAEHAAFLATNGLSILHQVGPGRMSEAARPQPGYQALEYLQDVAGSLSAATLVLARGGASTLAELGALRQPAWIVPYPHHQDRHQELNARELGLGVRIVQEQQLGLGLARELLWTCGAAGASERARMSSALAGLVPLDAAERMFEQLCRLASPATADFQSDVARS
jgi:UDP-N-acetylglucosamine--N-acetylmuramyl-(pentapeptide) pyrophosphoryl-undecaprenol N-acetylglucosamine transferase